MSIFLFTPNLSDNVCKQGVPPCCSEGGIGGGTWDLELAALPFLMKAAAAFCFHQVYETLPKVAGIIFLK